MGVGVRSAGTAAKLTVLTLDSTMGCDTTTSCTLGAAGSTIQACRRMLAVDWIWAVRVTLRMAEPLPGVARVRLAVPYDTPAPFSTSHCSRMKPLAVVALDEYSTVTLR